LAINLDYISIVGESRKKTAKDLTDQDMTDLMIATTLVQDAVNRRCIEINEDKDSFVAWRNYNNPGLLFLHQLCLLIIFLLLLVEDPAVKLLDVEPYYYIPLSVEVLILLFFCFRLDQLRRAQGYEKWKNPKNLIFVLAIALTFVDILVYVILREVEGVSVRPNPDGLERREIFRFMRALRPIFIICSEEKESMRRAVTNIWKTIPDILSVLLLLICSILLFALMALKLFGERDMTQYGAPSYYFKDYWNSFYDLYVLMTTANSPDIFMPAYNDSDGWMIFFMIFIILDTYIFMNLFLAVIYNNYKNNVKSDVENILGMKEKKLRRAFRIFQRVFGQVDYGMFKWLMEQTSSDRKGIKTLYTTNFIFFKKPN
jgi:two pore calcium channel protein 3